VIFHSLARSDRSCVVIRLCSSEVALLSADTGSLSLISALIATSQRFPSPELIESVADALTAMSSFPDLHERLVLEGGALSFLAPLCVEGVGIERQEASLGTSASLACTLFSRHSIVCCRRASLVVLMLRFN
jgi:hypothetical protein